MDEVMLLEDETEDKILARALEESLRHYREVEIPRLSQQADFERPGTSRDDVENDSFSNSSLQIPKQPILYTGKEAEGFDISAGRNWIYPTNYPIRQYQYNIVKSALFKNTLVSLPTGLGKTFIAAVVMYNFYRWFPRGKVIFMAPTKPLVHQQIDSCYKVMGIPHDDTAEMTGNMSPSERAKAWESKRVFFLTPQVLTNDLTCGACPAATIKCVVVDEAHKAVGNHSYCQVIKALLPFNNKFRVLALSATPGSDMQAVMQVIHNLLIAHVELRSEESPEIAEFTHKRNVETVIVSLGPYLSGIQERYLSIVDRYLTYLKNQKVLFGNMVNHTKFGLLQARDVFRKSPPLHIPRSQYGTIEASFAVCVTLLHSLELLSQYGLRSFFKFLDGVLQEERGQPVVQGRLKHDVDLEQLLEELREKLGAENQAEPEPDVSMAVPTGTQLAAPYIYSHPKLEKLQEVVVDHFRRFGEKNVATRTMIFCQYRDTVIEVCHILQKFHPLVKPMTFVGQTSSGKSSRGFTQKQQLTVMRKFRSGGYNTLISTCVGEEGLDIGEVDLIVCFDAHKSPIRLVQRMGRTGRKREGRIVMLITEGKEHSKYKSSMYQNQTINKKLLGGNLLGTHLYGNNPRMIPQGLDPECYQMYISVPVVPEKKTKRKNQDIRKLLGKPGGSSELVTKNMESSSPYCTDEDLTEMEWDGKFVPEFNMLIDSEEMHAIEKSSLRNIFNDDLAMNREKLNMGEWLEWQRDFQCTELVKHSIETTILVELLEYADKRRCEVMPSQATGLLSQMNTTAMWKKKKGKKSSVKQKTSNAKLNTKKKQERVGVKRDFHLSCETDGEGNNIADYFRVPAPVPSIQKTITEEAKNVSMVEVEPRNVEVVEISDDCITDNCVGKDKETHPISQEENHNKCYLCKNGLFDCDFLLPYTLSHKNIQEVEQYKPIDLSCIENITKEDIIAFDVKQLITPPSSPASGHRSDQTITKKLNSETSSNGKSSLFENTVVPNFNLDYCALEQCLFGEESSEFTVAEDIRIPEREKRPSDVLNTQLSIHSERAELQESCLKESEKVEQSSEPQGGKEYKFNNDIKCIYESPKVSILKTAQKDLTPVFNEATWSTRAKALGYNIENTLKPDGILMSPISPILCSQKSTRKLPVCSTPKVHRKNLFSKKILSEDDKVKTELDSVTNKNSNVKNKEENLTRNLQEFNKDTFKSKDLLPSKTMTIPKLNFDLINCTQLLNDLDSLEESSSDKNKGSSNKNDILKAGDHITSSSSMCSITQLINMVDKTSTSSEKFTESTSTLKLKTGDLPKISSPKNETNQNNSSVTQKKIFIPGKNRAENAPEQNYFHDSDDDLFADLPLDKDNFEDKQNVTVIQNRKVKTVAGLKIKSSSLVSKTIVSLPKNEISNSVFHSELPSLTTIPGIEKLRDLPVQVNNRISKQHNNITHETRVTYQQNTNLNNEEHGISQKVTSLYDSRNGSPRYRAIVEETRMKKPISVFDSQSSPLTKVNLSAKPLNEDLAQNSKKSLSLKHKSKTTNINDLHGLNATVAKCDVLMEENFISNKQGKKSPDNSLCIENDTLLATPKKRKDSISQFRSPIKVIPGIETTYRTVISDLDILTNSTTQSRLSLKRKHKRANLNHSNMNVHKIESDNDKSTSSPKLKKSKLCTENTVPVTDIQFQSKYFKMPEKYNHPMSVKKQNISDEKADTSNSKKSVTSFNNSQNVSKNLNEEMDHQLQENEDDSPILSTFIKERTSNESITSNFWEEKKIISNKSHNTSTTNENEPTYSKLQLSQGDSPIVRPMIRKKVANISSTSNESSELLDVTSVEKNLAFNASVTSEENNNSRISSGIQVKDKLESKEYENKAKERKECNVISLLSSDDSDFESQAVAKQQKICQSKNLEDKTHKNKKEHRKKLKQSAPRCIFVESEAEESDSCPSSSDGEDTSGLDNYDSSFVSESGNQSHAEDIQVKFLNSVIRSPGRLQGRFKIPSTNQLVPVEEVCSQPEDELDNSYEKDSFCVDEEVFTEMLEDSVLEVAEAALEAESKWKRRKRKRNNSDNGTDDSDIVEVNVVKKKDGAYKKRRRIVMIGSSESEDEIQKSLAVKNIGERQTGKQTHVPVYSNYETRDYVVQHSDIHKLCNSKVESTKSKVIDHNNHVAPCSSKGPAVLAKESDLNFSDWDYDEIDNVLNSGFGKEKEKSDQSKTPAQEKMKNLPPTDRNFLDSDFCNFDLGNLEELVTSPVLSCSGSSKKSGSKVVRSLKTEFQDKITVYPVPHKSSLDEREILKDNNERSSVLERTSSIPGTSSISKVGRNIQDKFSETAATAKTEDSVGNSIVLMANRQVSSAPEIATALRAVHNVTVSVRSFLEADYIVSWRLGILRVLLSDFVRASPKNSNLASSVRVLRSNFTKHILVIENDKLAPLARSKGMRCEIWNKTSIAHVTYLRQAGVDILYSTGKGDTAHLIAKLSQQETLGKQGIKMLQKNVPGIEARLQFYYNLPNVNIAMAMRMCYMFPRVIDFIDRCNTVKKIQEVLEMDVDKAARIYLVLRQTLKPKIT